MAGARACGVQRDPQNPITPRGGEPAALRASDRVRADAYLIVAAGRPLYAATPEELAEIAECALAAGGRIEPPTVRGGRQWPPLSGRELGRFLRALNLHGRHRRGTPFTRRGSWPRRRSGIDPASTKRDGVE
jgi:hypothetical protein